MTKILFVGAGDYCFFEPAFYEAAKRRSDLDAHLFTWHDLLNEKPSLIKRAENKFSIGPHVAQINRMLCRQCQREQYDIIFLYTCRIITPHTVAFLQKNCKCLAIYNNDDPFSSHFAPYFWRHYRRALPYSDLCYVFRESNIRPCLERGAKQVKLLRSYYLRERNFPIDPASLTYDSNFPDVVFLGHFEDDERLECIRHLVQNGVRVGLPRTWESILNDAQITFLDNTHPRYNEYLNRAKIALVFLSKINHDTYTQRCFEIPAAKTAMFSVYTDDLATLFAPEKEIVFFRNKEELLQKVRYYLQHPIELSGIGENGNRRLLRDGHDADSRVEQILSDYYTLLQSHSGQDH